MAIYKLEDDDKDRNFELLQSFLKTGTDFAQMKLDKSKSEADAQYKQGILGVYNDQNSINLMNKGYRPIMPQSFGTSAYKGIPSSVINNPNTIQVGNQYWQYQQDQDPDYLKAKADQEKTNLMYGAFPEELQNGLKEVIQKISSKQATKEQAFQFLVESYPQYARTYGKDLMLMLGIPAPKQADDGDKAFKEELARRLLGGGQ